MDDDYEFEDYSSSEEMSSDESMNDFIEEDLELVEVQTGPRNRKPRVLEESYLEEPPAKKRRTGKTVQSYKDPDDPDTVLKDINSIIRNSVITELDIVDMNCSIETKVWFIEHLKILSSLDDRSQEYYNLKHRILQKKKDIEWCTEQDIVEENKLIVQDNIGNLTLKQQILRSNHTDYVKGVLYRKYKHLEGINKDCDEYYKLLELIKAILKIPTECIPVRKDLHVVKSIMNSRIYKQNDAKQKILETVARMFNSGSQVNNIIGFVGEPGVGKTAFARCLSEAMGLPMEQISLGGADDASFLSGCGYTYVGSRPGNVVTGLHRLKCKNGIILFDEFDKINMGDQNGKMGEVVGTMLHILDYSQNYDFRDKYMPEIPIDLSNVVFILSINPLPPIPNKPWNSMERLAHIDPILLDRLPLVWFDGYNVQDKIDIARFYTVPNLMRKYGFTETDLYVTDEAIRHIVTSRHYEKSGIRSMEMDLQSIFDKANVVLQTNGGGGLELTYSIPEFLPPLVIDLENVDILTC